MACSSCGKKYPRSSRQRNMSMKKPEQQKPSVAPQPAQGDVAPTPEQPEIITAGQQVVKDLGDTTNKKVEVVPYPSS